MAPARAEPRRRIPSVDALLRSEPGKRASATFGRVLMKRCLGGTLEEVREAASRGVEPPTDDIVLARAVAAASRAAGGLTRVINATGVVLHTGLGRSPLPEAAAAAAARAGAGYSDLEVDRETGERGRRTSRAETLLTAITGAEDALVVNNGAAGVMLALAALARGKQVLVSRGELIEIGGGFRIPEIIAASGARMVEVGTTNRTRTSDYRAALSDKTAMILKVHPSNYRVVGFTAGPSARELSTLASRSGIPFVYDLGSGLLDTVPGLPDDEPTAARALADGADLVIFSGDKLLGGPQAGVILGRRDAVERCRRHPLFRAVRPGRLVYTALEATLRLYLRGEEAALASLPVLRRLTASSEELRRRARRLERRLARLPGCECAVVECDSQAGSGSLPAREVPSWGVTVAAPPRTADDLAAELRRDDPSILVRIREDAVLFDVRTLDERELPAIATAVGALCGVGA